MKNQVEKEKKGVLCMCVWLRISNIMLEHSMPTWSVCTIPDICSCIYASEDITTLIGIS